MPIVTKTLSAYIKEGQPPKRPAHQSTLPCPLPTFRGRTPAEPLILGRCKDMKFFLIDNGLGVIFFVI